MFLTRQSVHLTVLFILSVQFIIIIKKIIIIINSNSIFLGSYALLNFIEIWRKLNILLKQFVSATPVKLFNRVLWVFVIDKDIQCSCTYLQEILILFFKEKFISVLNFGQNYFVQLRWNRFSTCIMNLNAEEKLLGNVFYSAYIEYMK